MQPNECKIYWGNRHSPNKGMGWEYRHAAGSGRVNTLADLEALAEHYTLVGVNLVEAHVELHALARDELIKELKQRGDAAYASSWEIGMSTPCLGFEAKLRSAEFGAKELQAHRASAEQLGRHRAFYEVVELLIKGNQNDTKT